MDKQAIREAVWDDLEASGTARFPYPPHGRIPNFEGANAAADRLADVDAWRDATAIKANPDAPQLPVRRAALRAGKTIYMAVPRLREERCFLELDPVAIDDYEYATTVGGAPAVGRPRYPDEMEPIDLIVAGSVAVSTVGDRIGKGEGYSDLEFAILRELDLVDRETTTVTTVHERQLFETPFETDAHDVPIDEILTPDRRVSTGGDRPRPIGIDWDALDEERIDEIPVLRRLRER
ncbi:MAG: 5-formyltetrahydrofolate cyclo-ligase [Halobacteriota archaeon]